MSDGTANVVVRVDSDTDIDGTATPGGNFSVTALVGQFDTTAPFDTGYQLLPRGLSDIVAAAPTVTATPTTVNFGDVTVGSAATQSVTITNTNPFAGHAGAIDDHGRQRGAVLGRSAWRDHARRRRLHDSVGHLHPGLARHESGRLEHLE